MKVSEEWQELEAMEEHLQPKLDANKKLLLEEENIILENSNTIENINNILVMSNRVMKKLQDKIELERNIFIAINKLSWNCVDNLSSILDKIEDN